MKIFFGYILFVLLFLTGFYVTLMIGLPNTTTYDGLVAFSGMCFGAAGASLVIVMSREKKC
tara:strand:+ start:355 stop:537 length:183 start_codon:yes stop_codon:yes gene_type:complete